MFGTKKSLKPTSSKALAPLIYLNDPSNLQIFAKELARLIPDVSVLDCVGGGYVKDDAKCKPKHLGKSLIIMTDTHADDDNEWKLAHVNSIRTFGTATHLITINIVNDADKMPDAHQFGADHLNIVAGPDTATKIYQWLFTAMTVQESLYLIPDEEMKQIDLKLFPDYAYCPLNEAKLRPKDAKVQFVALITTKPQVVDGKKLVWTVADKSGTAKFYFQYRDAMCQYTWDWVLSLKPGERKALARMPMIQIKEKKRVRLVKAPFRATAAVIKASGTLLSSFGNGVSQIGKAMTMGPSNEWVPEYDVGTDGKKIDWTKEAKNVPAATKKHEVKVFNEKGERNWGDNASVASTNVDSDFDEKCAKEFC